MKVCKFSECNNQAKCKGWCAAHYAQIVRGAELKPIRLVIHNCSLDDCYKSHYARGLCKGHYQKELKSEVTEVCVFSDCSRPRHTLKTGYCKSHQEQYRQGLEVKSLDAPRLCSLPDCTSTHFGYGFCLYHYNRSEKELLRNRLKQVKRRALILETQIEEITPEMIASLVSSYGGLCAVCAEPWEHLDHIHPIAKGGSHTIDNLQPLCATCNLSKGPRLMEDWLPKRLEQLGMAA